MKKKMTKSLDFRGRQFPVIVQEDSQKGYWVSCPIISGRYSHHQRRWIGHR